MPAIGPFRALRFSADRDPAAVTSPPYDCMAKGAASTFLDTPDNIAHILLARRHGGPGVEAAAERLSEWLEAGVVARDDEPALYLYEITRPTPEGPRPMRGLLCRLALDPEYADVGRHESTLPDREGQRARRRAVLACDTEPIWLLYRDERAWVEEVLWSNAHDDLLDFTDEEAHRHRLWRVDRLEAIGEVVAQFEDRRLVIADGHHRYQAAVDHWRQSGRDEDGSILACLVRDDAPGLGIMATHRLVRGAQADDLDGALALLDTRARRLVGPPSSWADALDRAEQDGTVVVVVGRDGDGQVAAAAVPLAAPPEDASVVDRLAVTQAHRQILAPWGVDLDRPEDHLAFTRDPVEAAHAVAAGRCDLALLLPPERVSDVLDAAAEGHLMPQKSTHFVPKLRSGIVLSPLDEARPRPWTEKVEGPGAAEFRMPRL